MSCKFVLRSVVLIVLLGLLTLRPTDRSVALFIVDDNWQALPSRTPNLLIPQDGSFHVSSEYRDALAFGFTNSALASVRAGYDISWWTVDGGGGSSSGGDYNLIGTVGQPDAVSLTGGG